MGILMEELAYCPKIRLFRWNEKLVDKKNLLKDSQGLCLFDISTTNVSISRTHHPDSESVIKESQNPRFHKVIPFDLHRLLSADQDNLPLTTTLVNETALFLPETETISELGRQISDHLSNDFQLNKNKKINCFSTRGPRLVMVVQIRVWRWVDYTCSTDPNVADSFSSVVDRCNGEHREESSSDGEDDDDDEDYDNSDEYIEKWESGEVRWYDYSDEAAMYWLNLRNYLGEPKHDNLLTRALTKDEPRGLWEIPPTSLVLHTNSEAAEAEVEEEFCSICLNGFAIDNLDEIERTICCHVFHKTCIWKWLSKSNSCPFCRQPLPLLASNCYTLRFDAS